LSRISKILVPVDVGASSRPVVEMAIDLAQRFAATIELFHVWQPPAIVPTQLFVVPEAGGVPMPAEDVARSLAGARLEELAASVRAAGVRDVRSHVGVGDPAHEIVELARSGRLDLIVMGTHGRTGVSHAVLGSVAEKVLRHAPCPILTVRARD